MATAFTVGTSQDQMFNAALWSRPAAKAIQAGNLRLLLVSKVLRQRRPRQSFLRFSRNGRFHGIAVSAGSRVLVSAEDVAVSLCLPGMRRDVAPGRHGGS